jgi:tRNA dimethylallyltransferase
LRSALYRKAEAEGTAILYQELARSDPEASLRIHPQDVYRIIRALEVYALSQRPISCFQREHGFRESPYQILKIGLHCGREELYQRIESRVDRMMEGGWVEEVKSLLDDGYAPSLKSMQSLGYRSIISHLAGEMDLERTMWVIKRDTRHYAKRQATWFRSDPEIQWFLPDQSHLPSVEKTVAQFLEKN